MHIKELQLIGFKSFQDKATLRFSPRMNAVIGPNGCGKTNVLDALRWVLGEQSFSLLRCGKNEDLIFGGTATVAPTNIAEVRLVLAEDEGSRVQGAEGSGSEPQNPRTLEPSNPSEIEIRRRYFRTGESEYYLNRQPCRLRDIQDVFLSSGTGTKAYSIFDLRQMREIISGNIRKMFEEAATLAKYQDAKADCQRKLALTDTDLTRLDDIIAERERVVRSLQRQAGKLRAFDKLKSEEKGLRLLELKSDFDALGRELERARADTASMEEAEAGRVNEIHRLDEELKTLRQQLRDLQQVKDELAERVRSQRQVAADLDGQNLLAKQRIAFLLSAAEQAQTEHETVLANARRLEQTFQETLARLSEANEKQAQAQARIDRAREETRLLEERLYELRKHESALRQQGQDQADRQHGAGQELARVDAVEENLKEALARVDSELAALAVRTDHVHGELAAARADAAKTGAQVDALRQKAAKLRQERGHATDERSRNRSRALNLRDERATLDSELAVLRAAAAVEQSETAAAELGADLLGDVSQFVDVTPGWERACEAVLYAVAELLVTREGADATRLVELGAKHRDLRFTFAPAGADRPRTPDPGRQTPDAEPGIEGPLEQFVRPKEGAPEVVRRILADSLVVGSAADIDRLAAKLAGRALVTRDGVCRFEDGRVVVDMRGTGRLAAARMIHEKSERRGAAGQELARLEDADTALGRRIDELEKWLNDTEFEMAEAERHRASLDATVAAINAQSDEQGRDLLRLTGERRSIEAQARQAAEKRQSAALAAGEAGKVIGTTAAAIARSEEEVAEQERRVRESLEKSAEALAQFSEARQEVSRLETENAYAKRAIDESRFRLSALEKAAAGHRAEAAGLEQTIASRAGDIGQAQAKLADMETEAGKLHVGDLARAEETLEANIAEMRRAQEQHQALLMEQRLKLYELAQRSAAITEEAQTSFGTDIATFQPEESAEVAERLAQVRRRLETLGQVNPLAGQEYVQEKGDLERLRVQRDDVASARANLEQTLLEIDRHAQEQFATTYAEVRGHFREIFKELFLEGEADLVMMNDANPLESEIGIVARPRGKNPKRLEQLSDGEKALLAVSLLFAFYRVKPAPFCFLDEVDAPLDDANVGRFADYLQSIAARTQVVIITHNRLTVERAEVVFGVTAEQPGISKLVSVSLAEYRKQAQPVA